MNSAFDLSTCCSKLKTDLTLLDTLLKFLDATNTHILERVLQAGIKVRQEGLYRTLVLDIARDTLGDLHR